MPLRHPFLPIEISLGSDAGFGGLLPDSREYGFVAWSAIPPVASSWHDHRESFADCFLVASQFVETWTPSQIDRLERRREQCIALGEIGLFLVRDLARTSFERRADGTFYRNERGFTLVGRLGEWPIWFDPTLPHDECLLWSNDTQRPRFGLIRIVSTGHVYDWQTIVSGIEHVAGSESVPRDVAVRATRWLIPGG